MNTIVWNNVKQIIVTLSNCHPSHCLFNSCNYIKAPCLITSGSTSDSILSSTSGSTSTCFCGMVDRRKAEPYFQPGPLSEILTIANLRHAASRIWTCAEPVFRLWWMKLCSSDNHSTTALSVRYWLSARLVERVVDFVTNITLNIRKSNLKFCTVASTKSSQ